MKRISMIIVATLSLALLVYAHSRTRKSNSEMSKSSTETPTSQPQTDNPPDKTVATHDRLNRYFQSEVLPKLKTCWKSVEGDGTIEIKFTYTKAGGNWTWDKLGVSSSTLPKRQDAIALKCMQDAIRATSFPVRGGDGAGNKFVVHWSWPVPWPADASELAAKRRGGPTGGCDGFGTPKRCLTSCSPPSQTCPTVCVGWETCEPSGTGCLLKTPCASGGPFPTRGPIIQ